MRRLLVLLVAVLTFGAAPALAQDPVPTPTPTATDAPDDGVLERDEIPPESTPDPSDDAPCEPGPDADYNYCGGCNLDSADADYVYCAASGAGPPPAPRHTDHEAARPLRTLAFTGADPALVALFGFGLVLAGAGLRRVAPSR
jgi:hypothetical protein